MRRGFSIVLMLIFGLAPLSPLVEGSEDANLPPCCRRHGAHHCAMYRQIMAMRARQALDPRSALSAPSTCPLYPGPRIGILMPVHALTIAATEVRVEFPRTFSPVFAIALVSSRPGRTHAGRGPPATDPS